MCRKIVREMFRIFEPDNANGARVATGNGARDITHNGARDVTHNGARFAAHNGARFAAHNGARFAAHNGARFAAHNGARFAATMPPASILKPRSDSNGGSKASVIAGYVAACMASLMFLY
jgi:hypothetical protein